jgi:hypothetical protein
MCSKLMLNIMYVTEWHGNVSSYKDFINAPKKRIVYWSALASLANTQLCNADTSYTKYCKCE